ncbi:MAG: DUF4258 domain-containing protein [Candidatus Dependentiae bacterium]
MKVYFKLSILLFSLITAYAQSASTSILEQRKNISLIASNRINISTNLEFTKHALERMEERMLPINQVQKAICKGLIKTDNREDIYIFEKDGCRVVLSVKEKLYLVITVINIKNDETSKDETLQRIKLIKEESRLARNKNNNLSREKRAIIETNLFYTRHVLSCMTEHRITEKKLHRALRNGRAKAITLKDGATHYLFTLDTGKKQKIEVIVSKSNDVYVAISVINCGFKNEKHPSRGKQKKIPSKHIITAREQVKTKKTIKAAKRKTIKHMRARNKKIANRSY